MLNQNNDLDQIKEIREYLEKHLRLDQNQPENASKENTRQNAIHIFLSGNKKLINYNSVLIYNYSWDISTKQKKCIQQNRKYCTTCL